MLGEMLVSQKDTQPFQGITPLNALKILRVMLGLVGVANPECYRTHDLRRGHAKDLQLAGRHHNLQGSAPPCVMYFLKAHHYMLFWMRVNGRARHFCSILIPIN